MSDFVNIPTRRLPVFFGPLRGANGNARINGPCGDTMEFWVRVEEGRLVEAMYTTDGCAHSIACGCAAAVLARGVTVEQARLVNQDRVLESLGEEAIPPESRHCALLAANTLHAALDDYEKRRGGGGSAARQAGEAFRGVFRSLR